MSFSKDSVIFFLTALFLFAGVLSIALYLTSTNVPTQFLSSVSAAEFADTLSKQSELMLIDIRTAEEYAEGHLTGAINLDYYDPSFLLQLDKIDRDTPLAIYCRSGNRTSNTLKNLEQMGFTNVTELNGGILAWQNDERTMICSSGAC